MKGKPANQYEIGEFLVKEGLLTRKQLDEVFSMQKSTGGSLAALAVKLGFVDEETVTGVIAKALGVEAVDIASLVIPEVLVRKIPREVIKRHEVLPVGMRGGALLMATSDPTDYSAIEEIQFLTDLPVEICLASRTGIRAALDDFYRSEDARQEDLRSFITSGDIPRSQDLYGGISPEDLQMALIPLLVEKGILSLDELVARAREIKSS